MFTGIIEAVGKVAGIERAGDSIRLTVSAAKVAEDVAIGDSVAIDGVCLTVTQINAPQVSFDAVHETMRKTTLGQLGKRVQHALRAFTAVDDKALTAAARTFPKTPFYDIEETLTTLGIGDAFVTVLAPNGAPTPPFATRLIPPAARMGPLTDAEMTQRLSSSAQVKEYATAIDRESAREMLAKRVATAAQPAGAPDGVSPAAVGTPARSGGRAPKPEPSTFEKVMNSPLTRTVAGVVARGIMGALLPRRRSTSSRSRRSIW